MANEKRTKKIIVPLTDDYRPNVLRPRIRKQYQERFLKLFCSLFDFQDSVTAEERIVILKNLWESGSFAVSRSPAPVEAFSEEMDLIFCKYAVDDFDYNMQPLHIHNAPLKASRAISRKRLTIGKDATIVYLNEFARLNPNYGARKTADRYISQIVNAKMTIATNLLLHKVPFFIPCDEDETDIYKEVMRQVFSDTPAIFAPAMMAGREPKALSLTTPYIIDKLESYCVRLENMFLDEIGIDNAKPVQSGQDRLLMDETNANNALINNFRDSIFSTLGEGFAEVKELFGREIKVKPRAVKSASVHEEINGQGQPEQEGESEQ